MKRLNFLRSLGALLLAPFVLRDEKPVNDFSQPRLIEKRFLPYQDGERFDEHRENDHVLMWRYNASAGKWDLVGHQMKMQEMTYTLIPSPWDEPYPQPHAMH